MKTVGFIAYRFRGQYYRNFHEPDDQPWRLARELVKWIPSDPEKFKEWKLSECAFYFKEEEKMRRLAMEDPVQDPQNVRYWLYHGRPSRNLFICAHGIQWAYVIDFDEDVFCVYSIKNPRINRPYNNYIAQYFRLDNIPRWLFNLNGSTTDIRPGISQAPIRPLIIASSDNVPAEYWADHLQNTPEPDLERLKVYERSSPQPMPTKQEVESLSAWKSLQLLFLTGFFQHFIKAFTDVSTYEWKSNFVFRQLAYAIICLLQESRYIRIHDNNLQRYFLVPDPVDATPYWEPPDTISYWIGETLIVPDEDIEHEQNRRAAIGLAIELASSHTSSHVTAVIFCIRCIVLVKINKTAQGLEVSHSSPLPLFTKAMENDPFAEKVYQTPGIMALLDLFSSYPPTPPPPCQFPRNLPAEICQNIFQLTDRTSQRALELSCRFFHNVAQDRPRIHRWTLLKYIGGREFIGLSSSSGKEHVVSLVPLSSGVRWWNGSFGATVWKGEKLQLGMPLFRVRKI